MIVAQLLVWIFVLLAVYTGAFVGWRAFFRDSEVARVHSTIVKFWLSIAGGFAFGIVAGYLVVWTLLTIALLTELLK